MPVEDVRREGVLAETGGLLLTERRLCTVRGRFAIRSIGIQRLRKIKCQSPSHTRVLGSLMFCCGCVMIGIGMWLLSPLLTGSGHPSFIGGSALLFGGSMLAFEAYRATGRAILRVQTPISRDRFLFARGTPDHECAAFAEHVRAAAAEARARNH